nr:putative reverse transcriptase domain-containing protein [Tanacetum cinerariifolium]
MPPRMMTRSAGQQTATPKVEGRVDGLVEEVEGLENQRAELVVELVIKVVKEVTEILGKMKAMTKSLTSQRSSLNTQVGNHANNIQGDVRSVNVGIGRNGCSYKESIACNPEDYDGKSGAIEDLMRKEFCLNNEMQKLEIEFWCHAIRAGHAAFSDRFHELARLVSHLVTLKNKRIERNGSLKKNTEKRGSSEELSRKENFRAFFRDCRAGPRMVTFVSARNPMTVRGAYFECGSTDHYKAACLRDNGNQERGGAFMMGAEEARQDPNIMTGTLTLNNHYATTLFDSSADYSFVSTTFIRLLDIEPSDLGFSYGIEIASEQLVEINKVIPDCKLKIEGHTFDIDLIPFGHGSFDVIIGMD